MVRRAFAEHDAGYLKLLASRLIASAPQTCVLLAATQEEPARVVVAASADLKIDCGTALREALAAYGLRGGGSTTWRKARFPMPIWMRFSAGLRTARRASERLVAGFPYLLCSLLK